MSEVDSSRLRDEHVKSTESSPLLGKRNGVSPKPEREEKELHDGQHLFDGLCNKQVFIGFMLFISLIFLKFCVSGRPDLPVGSGDVTPTRKIEDVILPDRSETLSVTYNPLKDSYDLLKDPQDPSATARATYHTNVNQNGWNFFEAKALPSTSSHSDYLDSLRAMGYLEGFSSWKQIVDFYPNYYQSIFDTKSPVLCNPDMRILRYLQDNYDFMEEKSLQHYKTSEYWLVVRGVLAQLDGLLAGFKEGQRRGLGGADDISDDRRKLHEEKEKQHVMTDEDLAALELTTMDIPSIMHFLILNGNGDMFTLIEKFAQMDIEKNITFLGVDCSRSHRRATEITEDSNDFIYEYGTSVLDRKRAKLIGKVQDGYRTDHCSAMVKVLPDGSDVVFGHNTWDDYRNMGPRVFKHYIYPKWPVKSKGESCGQKECAEKCAAREITSPPHTYFSSSPGWVTSVDDFYTTFTSPLPSENDDTEGCACACDKQERDGRADESDVNLQESVDAIETAVRENILNPKRSLTSKDKDEVKTKDNDNDTEDNNEREYSRSHAAGGGGRMAVIETSLEIYEPKLYDLVVPKTLLSWVRVRTSNTLAQGGADWADRFSFDHSGTYPNQWIIVDFEKFTSHSNSDDNKKNKESGNELKPGFLTILEEMPGMIRSHDQTDHLKQKTYWASYNIPFYDDLSLYSKNTQLCQTQQNVYLYQNQTLPGVNAAKNTKSENNRLGHANCYATCARARLFSRLNNDVVDLPSALKVMSHNDFKHDKEARGNPCEEIACREDLQPSDDMMNVFGAIDTKLSSVMEADTVYRGPFTNKEHDIELNSVSTLKEMTSSNREDKLVHIAPQPLVFPLPLVVPAVVDVSTEGDIGPGAVTMQSSEPSTSYRFEYKQPRIFARQGPTHDGDNKPFCWSDFETRHDAWVIRTRGSLEPPGGRRLRANNNKEMWRKRKPAFRYSHLGQPNCFNYEWEIMPPQ